MNTFAMVQFQREASQCITPDDKHMQAAAFPREAGRNALWKKELYNYGPEQHRDFCFSSVFCFCLMNEISFRLSAS